MITMTKNGIDVAIREEYHSGRVYGCYFLYRYGTYKQFNMYLEKSYIPIYERKKLEEYVDRETKLLVEIWKLKPTKKKQK